MHTINIVTGNLGKYKAANKYLSEYGIESKQVILPLVEIQGEDGYEIAKHKAKSAFEMLQEPLAVMDCTWSIPALNGFPGPYMSSIMKWFKLEDLLNLMKSKQDRTIILENFCCYTDGQIYEVFTRKLYGKINLEPSGNGNFIDRIVSFRKDGKSITDCENECENDYDEGADSSQWEKLAIWLSTSENLN